MKKKILFVSDSLDFHGAAKSLVNWLEIVDKSKYDVDLFLFHTKQNHFELPEGITLLPPDAGLEAYFLPARESIRELLRNRNIRFLFYRIKNKLLPIKASANVKLQMAWEKMLEYVEPIPTQYDLVISFQDYFTAEFIIKKTQGQKKISWNHNILDSMDLNLELYKKCLPELDAIVTVSNSAKDAFVKKFGAEIKQKMIVAGNPQNIKEIESKAKMPVLNFEIHEGFSVVSVGRLVEQKGFDKAIEIAKKLKARGNEFYWYIIGEGPERDKLAELIEHNKLTDTVFLLGAKSNPYAYMAKCSIYAQPSRFEADSMTVKEARIIRKTIIATPYAANLLSDGVECFVLPLDVDLWVEKIEELINHPDSVVRFEKQLSIISDETVKKDCNALMEGIITDGKYSDIM